MRGRALDDALVAVAPIVADVRERGDAAVREWTERLDGERSGGPLVGPGASPRRGPRTTFSTRSVG